MILDDPLLRNAAGNFLKRELRDRVVNGTLPSLSRREKLKRKSCNSYQFFSLYVLNGVLNQKTDSDIAPSGSA